MKKVVIFCLGVALLASCKNSSNNHYSNTLETPDSGLLAIGGPSDSLAMLHRNVRLVKNASDSVSTLIGHIFLEDYSDVDASTPSYLERVDSLKSVALRKRGKRAMQLLPNAIYELRIAMSAIDTSSIRLLSKLDSHEMFVLKFSGTMLRQGESLLKHP